MQGTGQCCPVLLAEDTEVGLAMGTETFDNVVTDSYFFTWLRSHEFLECFCFGALHPFDTQRLEEVIDELVI